MATVAELPSDYQPVDALRAHLGFCELATQSFESSKAPEDWRTPSPAGIAKVLQNARRRLGVRQSSGAFSSPSLTIALRLLLSSTWC
jgi:hypothetical protein